jgi:hypothetical protein
VLSLPFALRYRLAYDSHLVRDILHIFIQVVFSSLRGRAREYAGIRDAQCGAVTFVQRFGGAINLNIHLHSLVPDGIYYENEQKQIRFQRLPPPSDSEVMQITERIARRIIRLLEGWGLGPDADPEADPLTRDQPLLAELYTASVQGRITTGPKAGNYLATAGFQAEPGKGGRKAGPRCANISGFSLHANARWRSQIVPYDPGESDPIEHSGCNAEKQEMKTGGKEYLMPSHSHPKSYSWSELLKRPIREASTQTTSNFQDDNYSDFRRPPRLFFRFPDLPTGKWTQSVSPEANGTICDLQREAGPKIP